MKVICSSEESLYRPEAVRWRQRMEMMEPLGDTVVLLPCSMKKPYSNSKSHQKFRKLTRSFQELIVTSPFGICPRELENTFPIQSYDVSTTGKWSEDEIEETGRLIAKYCEGKKIVAVGTTTVRTLETAYKQFGCIKACKSASELFIYPPYEFKVIDKLITNFHLPKSTLLMLVSALAGKDFIFRAYEEAIKEKYRFYSYGDCMFINKE